MMLHQADSDEDEIIDVTEIIAHLRTWEAAGERKRTAKSVAANETSEQGRKLARSVSIEGTGGLFLEIASFVTALKCAK